MPHNANEIQESYERPQRGVLRLPDRGLEDGQVLLHHGQGAKLQRLHLGPRQPNPVRRHQRTQLGLFVQLDGDPLLHGPEGGRVHEDLYQGQEHLKEMFLDI